MGSFFNELKRRNVVRVSAAYIVASWLLIQAAGALEPALLLPDWVDRVVTVFLLIGFPVVIIFAWAFEMTPDGVKLQSQVDRAKSITTQTGKKLEYFTIAGLSLVVVFFLAKEFLFDTPDQSTETAAITEQANPTSIAVLPFEDYSENADQGYFSHGIAEEILNLLAKTKGLRVAARTSSFAFADSELDIREIGGKLSVETVLEGSIRKSGNTIRITAQLINIDDGYHLWSETYDRNYNDIFQIQDDIAASILASLKVHLLGEEEQLVVSERTQNLDAYSAFLIGKERLALRTRENIESARDKFEQAIQIDPDYAPARVALAHAWLLLEHEEFGGTDKKEADAVIKPQLESALALSPDLPEAVAMRGLHHQQRYRFDEALVDFNRAIQLNPNYALAYLWRSRVYYEQKQYLDMLADKEKAYSLDPMSLDISAGLAYNYGSFWRPRDADRVIARMFELHPGHPRAYQALGANLSAHGRYAEAALMLEQALEEHPDNAMFRGWHAWIMMTMGLFDEAEAEQNDETSFWIYMHQGRIEQAREILEKNLAEDLPVQITERWLASSRYYHWSMRSEMGTQPFSTAVKRDLAFFDENNIPWQEQCRPYLLYDLLQAGVTEGTTELMEECRQATEERLKAKYLCPCTWFNLVLFATLDNRHDDAIKRTQEWLDNGDSFSILGSDPILLEWADRPEYQEILARNDEQVQRQQQLYLAGISARDKDPNTSKSLEN